MLAFIDIPAPVSPQCNRLQLLSVSEPHEADIDVMAADRALVYTAVGRTVRAWRRGTEVGGRCARLRERQRGAGAGSRDLVPFSDNNGGTDTRLGRWISIHL